MREFSRALYRHLRPLVTAPPGISSTQAHVQLLEACERGVDLFFSEPEVRHRCPGVVFGGARHLFTVGDQVAVHRAVETMFSLLGPVADKVAQEQVQTCAAFTRGGQACQRIPRPGRRYCPSHRHLEETLERPEVLYGGETASTDREPPA